MKNVIIFLVVFFITARLYSQTDNMIALFLTVQNQQNKPVKHVPFSLKEAGTGKIYQSVTNQNGIAEIDLPCNKVFMLSFPDVPEFMQINTPYCDHAYFTQTIIYTPTSKALEQINAWKAPDTLFCLNQLPNATETHAQVTIKVADNNRTGVKNINVYLYGENKSVVYACKTNNLGEAYFSLPVNTNYIAGLNQFERYGVIRVPNRPYITYKSTITFEPTNIKEVIKNDTIYQKLSLDTKETSDRNLITINVKDYEGNPLANEPVFLDVTGENKVYTASTNANGKAVLLIPKGKQYTFNLKYERDIDLLDYPLFHGFHTTDITCNYMGSATVENFYKENKRDKSGFFTEFLETPAEPAPFNPEWIERTGYGFKINFESKSTVTAPVCYENHLFVSEGYYSRNFYSVNKNTLEFEWGITLGESGASPAIIDDSILLLITQSCTLYAVDINSGRLLWSKWLGPNLYSAPSANNGKVFAVYPNGDKGTVPGLDYDGRFTIVAFDLKTGKIIWQNWVDSETLAAPAVAGGKVYLTTNKGSLYAFDENTGKQLGMVKAKAITPPTIIDQMVFVSVLDKDNQISAVYNAQNLAFVKKNLLLTGKAPFKDATEMNPVNLMSYNGSRIMHYNGKNYNFLDGLLICSDYKTGNIIWQDNVSGTFTSIDNTMMPVAANKKIIVPLQNGKLQLYDSETGKKSGEYITDGAFYNQPVVHEGWIYSGTQNGKIISVKTNNPAFTGFSSWGGNAANNPVFGKNN